MIVFVVAIWLRVADGRTGVNLTNAINSGKRPLAPALATKNVSGAKKLPSWYKLDSTGKPRVSKESKVMVVNWWASWCRPCQSEAPILEKISHDYADKVLVVGMNASSEDSASAAAAFAERYKLTFPLVRGNRSYNAAWGVKGYPETFVVGVDGRISSYVPGAIDEETIRGLVEHELSKMRSK